MKFLLITFIGIFATVVVAQDQSMQLTCHKPLAAENGADILAEIDFNSEGSKNIMKSGPIFIRVADGKRSVTINSNIMSGQSAQSGQILLYVEDLRIHSLVINLEKDQQSIVKTVKNEVVLEYKTNCTPVPKIPKKK